MKTTAPRPKPRPHVKGTTSPRDSWRVQTGEAILRTLGSTPAGLSSAEAATRLLNNGPNQLIERKHISRWRIFASQFNSLLVWILIVAGIVSGFMGQKIDALAILAIVILNAAIGYYQEYRAEQSIAALRQLTAPRANVQRDGQPQLIAATAIVIGDILALEAGDWVPADARLLETSSLKCVESTLTGEAEAVTKHSDVLKSDLVPLGDSSNMVFMGTSVAGGRGKAVVVATAMNTELGRIAGLLTETGGEEKTPLQQRLNSLAKVLVWSTLGIIGLLFGLGLMRGTKPLDLLLNAISLAVAAVPEGLPAVVTVALALGVSRMARSHALVRRLTAVETLGCTTVICTDKTGTLTLGQMTVRALYVSGRHYEVKGEGYSPQGQVLFQGKPTATADHVPLLQLGEGLVAGNYSQLQQKDGVWSLMGDPTEGALLSAGIKAGANREQIEREWPKLGELPFDSDRKRSSITRRMPDGTCRLFANGAPGPLVGLCTQVYTSTGVRSMTDEDRAHILAQTSRMAKQALRVLASAYRDLAVTPAPAMNPEEAEHDLVFVGLSGMYDPPRPEASVAVAKCQAAGIRVVMITGDHPETASAIAREIGIASPAGHTLTGAELEKLTEAQLRKQAADIAVYARVTAEHKLRIVRAWQAREAVVAMTGDGVNDAPAIKGADIGIAMGKSGTEVTRQAADMILTDDNFSTIVAAIEQGRGIYDNIRKTLQYLLAGNTAELLLMTLCLVLGMPIPLLPIHLLWINLVTDGLPALCLATDPIEADLMKRQPRRRNERIANPKFVRTMLLTGLLTAGVTFAVFLYGLRTGTTETARSSAFTVLVFAELLRAFGARSETEPIWRIPFFSNINLIAVVVISLGLQVLSQHSAVVGKILNTGYMPLMDAFGLLVIGAIPLGVLELLKLRSKR
ncbi:MAG: cation-translocating P-type ATPase [Verrucomicrobiales bacterium]|nr:cation-translocating P-type ATPase [Verrucomicrobiales bacterium]